MTRIVQLGKGGQLHIAQQSIGEGNEGSIHAILKPQKLKNYCVKIYAKQEYSKKREQKIRYMTQHAPKKIYAEQYLICWPIELVYEQGKFVGFVMPLAFPNCQPVNLQELCSEHVDASLGSVWQSKFGRSNKEALEQRMKLCVNIAFVINMLHRTKQYVLGDLKPENILINETAGIALVDCDAIQIVSGQQKLFPSTAITPEYAPPERAEYNVVRDVLPVSWDTFSMAVIFYEVLVGIHPFTASFKGKYHNIGSLADKVKEGLYVHGAHKKDLETLPPIHKEYNNLPLSLKIFFRKAFEVGQDSPEKRPSAQDWGKTMYNLILPPTPTIVPNPSNVLENIKKVTFFIVLFIATILFFCLIFGILRHMKLF